MFKLSKNHYKIGGGGWGNLPRVLIEPNGNIINVSDSSYHSNMAREIWKKLAPTRASAGVYELVNEKGYIAIGSGGNQEIRVGRNTINDINSPAMLAARTLAKQWPGLFFEAEVGRSPKEYYVEPFIMEGRFVRKDFLQDLEDFEEPPDEWWENLSLDEQEKRKQQFAAPDSKSKSMREIKKMLNEEKAPNDTELLRQLRAEFKKIIKLLNKRGFYNAAELIKTAGSPRALIAPNGDVLSIPRNSFHGTEATKIWQKIEPSKVRVDSDDGFMQYIGGSALYDLVEKMGYISLGTAGGQELKANRATIKSSTHPATSMARRLAKQWIRQFFEAEIGELAPRIYYVAPFIKEGKFVRKDLKGGPLEDFEELPPDFEEQKELYKEINPEELFSEKQEAGGEPIAQETGRMSIRDIRKMLENERFPDDIINSSGLYSRREIRIATLNLLFFKEI